MKEMLELINNKFCDYEVFCLSEGINKYEIESLNIWKSYIELEYNLLGGF